MYESIFHTILPIITLILGYFLNILFLKPKAKSEVSRDFLIRRNVALQNFVFFIDFLLATNGRREKIGTFDVRDHLIRQNLCNSVFFPNKPNNIKENCDEVLELIYHIDEENFEERIKKINLKEIRDNIREYFNSEIKD